MRLNNDELRKNFEKIHETLELILGNQKKILQGKKSTAPSNKSLNKYESWFQNVILPKYTEISTTTLLTKLGREFPSMSSSVKKRIVQSFLEKGFIESQPTDKRN